MRVALGTALQLERPPTVAEWERLMGIASEQDVMGVAFCGVERLPKAQRPPLDVLMDWSAVVDYMERENRRLNALAVQVCQDFRRDGHDVCVLKGQGIGILSPFPLRRSPGDIDLWMKGGKRVVTSYMRTKYGTSAYGYDDGPHVSVMLRGVSVEVHHTPARLYAPWHKRRLRRLFAEVGSQPWDTTTALPEGAGTIWVPTLEFNLVFIFVHFFYHWVFEGCGMKQLMDYYFLTLAANRLDAEAKARVLAMMEQLSLRPALAACMYIFRLLGMDETSLLCAPDERGGKILFNDLLTTGVVESDDFVTGKYGGESRPRKFLRRLRRVSRIFPIAAVEAPFMMLNSVYRLTLRAWRHTP